MRLAFVGISAAVAVGFMACTQGDEATSLAPLSVGEAESERDASHDASGADANDARTSFSCAFGSATPPRHDPPVTLENVAGTRIRPRYVVLEDGTRLLYDLFDTALDTPCSLEAAVDGVMRCVPTAGTRVPGFVDAACSVAAALARPTCPPTRYARVGDGYVAIKARAETYRSSPGCQPSSPPEGDIYAVGEAVPLTAFVGFVEERNRLTNEIDAVVRVGEDGARLWLGDLHDAEHGVPAEIVNGPAGIRLFPKAKIETSCCGETTGQCGQRYTPCTNRWLEGSVLLAATREGDQVFGRGAPVASLVCGRLESLPPGVPGWPQCTTYERSPADVFKPVAVPIGCFAPGVERPSLTGRLRPTAYPFASTMPVLLGGVLVPPAAVKMPPQTFTYPRLLDTLTGRSCAVVPMAGSYRCISLGAFDAVEPASAYADAACTVPKVRAGTGPVAVLEDRPRACPDRGYVRMFERAPAGAPTPDYRRTTAGECVASGTSVDSPGVEHLPSEYAEVTVTAP